MAQLLKFVPLLASSVLLAAPADDPTRPPAAFLAGAASAPAEAPLQLQAILLSPQRKVATINGEQLAIGDRIRGYTLVSLGAQQAILQGPQGRIQLNLLPGQAIKRRPLPGEQR